MRDDERLERLLERHVDGVLDDVERRELEDMLRASAHVRRAFWEHAKWNAAIRAWGESTWGESGAGGGGNGSAGRSARESLLRWLSLGRGWRGRVASGLALLVGSGFMIAAGVAWLRPVAFQPSASAAVFTGGYDDRTVPMADVAVNTSRNMVQRLPVTTLRPQEETRLLSASGAVIDVSGNAVLGLASPSVGVLYSGTVSTRSAADAAGYSIIASNLRIVDRGGSFRAVRVGDHGVVVSVQEGVVDVQSRIRLPVASWSFEAEDAVTRRSPSDDGGHAIMLSAGVEVVDGGVGSGGLRFDNTLDSFAMIDRGTGPRVGSGSLASSVGITIEALIRPEWSGSKGDNDAIYRKEDGQYCVLLAFQNDSPLYDSLREPAVEAEQCLSFGLHLSGYGYRELDVPLDGRDGRPTLASLKDGRYHHVAATYDSFSGRKCVFIDGRLVMEWQYPRGTIILSGGPAPAFVGSSAGQENFTGVIDEFAIYDFTLSPAEVADHATRARAGLPYHDDADAPRSRERWRSIKRLAAAESGVFDERHAPGG